MQGTTATYVALGSDLVAMTWLLSSIRLGGTIPGLCHKTYRTTRSKYPPWHTVVSPPNAYGVNMGIEQPFRDPQAPFPKRTHNCGALNASDAGSRVTLTGWLLPER